MRRRHLLIGGAALVAWVWGVPRLPGLFAPELAFEAVPRLPGFRRVPFGAGSSGTGNVALLGIEEPGAGARYEALAAAPCSALFGPFSDADNRLPVAVFTDYRCPYCPEVSDTVRRLERAGAPIRVIWREWPVLGPRSEAAARIALAAAAQGAHDAVHGHLMRTVLRPGPAALADLAAEHGLDAEQLARDAEGPDIAARNEETRALAGVLGLPGTPGLAIGRTLAAGRIGEDRLLRLIELERARPACRD